MAETGIKGATEVKPGELNKKIRRIEITSRKLVEESFTGDYRSGFRGKAWS